MPAAAGDSAHEHSNARALVVQGPLTAPHRPRPASLAAEPQQALTPRRVLDAVRHTWKWACPTGLILATGSCLVVYTLFEPQYKASAWLRIEEEVPYLAFERKDAMQQSKGFVQTQIELLRSPMVLNPVASEPEVLAIPERQDHADTTSWLRDEIVIQAVGTSELHTVSFTCSKPSTAAHVVNSVIDSYFRLRAKEQGQRIERVIKILEIEEEARSQEVENLRKGVRDLAKQVTGRDPFQTAPEPVSQEHRSLVELEGRLVAAEVEESILRAKYQAFETVTKSQETAVPNSMVEEYVAQNPQLQAAIDELAEKQSQLKLLEGKMARGKDDPLYRRTAKEIEHGEKAVEELRAALTAQANLHLTTELKNQLADTRKTLETELENAKATREALQQRYQTAMASIKQSSGDTVSLRFKQEELARAEKVLDLISERIVMLRTEQGAPPRVWEMQRAEVPVEPVQPLPYRNLLLAAMLGFCAPFGCGVLREQLAARVTDAEFAGDCSELAVVGEITRLPTKRKGARKLGYREQLAVFMFEESVDMLRTSLLLRPHSGPSRILAVTSAVTREGKTTVAVQLAASIARANGEVALARGQRTLLIDGDLRDPSIHRLFRTQAEPGLSDVLAGRCSIGAAIVSSTTSGVDILPAGKLRCNPHTLLDNGRWSDFLQKLPIEYCHVIIDTPPILPASEAAILTRGADAVLLCALCDVTRMPQLKKAAARVAATGAHVAGVVLNGVSDRQYINRYGKYYTYSRSS